PPTALPTEPANASELSKPALADALQQSPDDKCGYRIEARSSGDPCRLYRKAAWEDREPMEGSLQRLLQEGVAPTDRRAERLLPFGRIARAAGQQREAVSEPLQQQRRVEHLDARRRELERERKSVQTLADR